MKITISNLAWEKKEDKEVIKLLKRYKVRGVEIAPTKIWKNPTKVSEKSIKKYRKFWEDNGIKIIATTSLLFGHPKLQIFSDNKTREKTLKYLAEVMRVTSALGAKAMVFGSPKNRSTNGFSNQEVDKIAQEFFYKVGKIAKKYKVYFGIEPNPPLYGTDFINSTKEAIDLVKLVGHPNFRIHLDTSTMEINKEPYDKTLKEGLKYAKHFHISEPGLKPIPQKGGVNHTRVSKMLRKLNYKGWLSIEMPLSPESDKLTQISKTLDFVTSIYNLD